MQQQDTRVLPPVAGALLYNAISGMSAAGWLERGAAFEGTLGRASALLCALRRSASLQQYLQQLSGGSGGGGSSGPCTKVWTVGTIAYRCHTCGLSPSSAICVDCFRGSGHEGHDYVMYTSGAASGLAGLQMLAAAATAVTRAAGAHRAAATSTEDEAVVRGIVGCALARLQLALEPDRHAGEARVAFHLMGWLQQLGQQPALRAIICEELLQPVSASVAAQATSLAATSHLQPEVASVARMLQQQREGLLQWLEQALPGPGDGRRPLPALGPGPHSLLYWQLSTLLVLEAALVEELASLLILLLYSVPFKEHFGRLLLAYYPHIGALGKRHAVTKALDRLTVQVFHLEETCLALARHDGLLEVLLGCLLDVLQRAVGEGGVVDGNSTEIKDRLYLRIAADLHLCLSHPSVVLELISPDSGPRAHVLFASAFLQVFRLLEGASPFRRQLGEHVLYESTAYLNTVHLEVHAMRMLKQGVLHTLLKAAEAGTVSPDVTAQALLFAVQRCLEALEGMAGHMQAAGEVPTFGSMVLSGNGQMSAHIPLERLAASFLAGLLHLASTSMHAQPYLSALSCALGHDEGQDEGERAAAVRRWEMCGLAAERVLSWMSQIRQRLWVRNGQQLLRLEAFYTSPSWSDHAQDCDLLAVQAWLISTPTLSRSLGFFAFDSGGAVLLRASSEASLAGAAAVLQDSVRQPSEVLRCCADWLRLLVQVLRERSGWHPTYSPLPLRRALLHILAVGPCSHSQLGDELPYELSQSPHFDRVLVEVADYRPPTAAATGQYNLKPECWRDFDPFYLHYTPRHLQTALHTAQEGGVWHPEWQLQLGMTALPGVACGLQRMLHHLLRIVWTALLAACVSNAAVGSGGGMAAVGSGSGGGGAAGGGGGGAEDCALAAISLLCLVLQRKEADLSALVSDSSGATLPLPPAWATPAAFLQKCEEHLAGSTPHRPGIIFLLRVLAGSEAWLDGSRREASWELRVCAAAAAVQAQQLLQAVWQHVTGQQPAGAGAAAAESAGVQVPARAEQQDRRRQQARQRRQQVQAGMRAQQARAAAALLEEEQGEEDEAVPAPEGSVQLMDIDAAAGGAAAGSAAAGSAAAGSAAAAATSTAHALPAHHPAAWERQTAECVLCHTGVETASLGLVAQLKVTQLPVLASVDPAAPLTPQHPGQPGGAIAVAAGAAGDGAGCSAEAGAETEAAGAAVAPFPAPGAGPRLSVFDRQPSMHLLCCGHILHASCLERYRASWRQRIASGQFAEGFQLLQPSPSEGEYLCPICRRLGNCLLPLAAAVPPGDSPAQPGAAQQEQVPAPLPVLSSQEAVQQLEQLVAFEGNWVSAPATASQQLVKQWQQAQACGAMAAPVAAQAEEALQPEALQLLPWLGCQAAGVAALCEFARLVGSKWMLQQHRLLNWLQHRATAREMEPFLWGIPVTAVAEDEDAAEAATRSTSSLQTALQQLLQQAAAAEDPAAEQALDAIALAAEAAAEVMGAQELAEMEEEDSEEEEQEGVPGGGTAALFEQLQQRAEEVAAVQQLHVVQQQHPGSAAEAAAQAACAPASTLRQHNHRFWAAATASGMLWSLLGSGIVQWEVAHRDAACQPSQELKAAHWRALQSLVHLALAAGPPPSDRAAALKLLQQLAAGGLQQLNGQEGISLSTDMSAALLPGLLQLQFPPLSAAYRGDQDPFALLLALLAALLSRPDRRAEPILSCSAHAHPAAVLQLLLAAVYPVAAGQAVALASGGEHAAADAAAAMAASLPLRHALEGAAASQLLPWLQRAGILLELLRCRPAPALHAAGPAAAAAVSLQRRLRLHSLSAALQSGAAGCLAPSRGSMLAAPGGLELSILTHQRQWAVSSLPLPPAPKLLQLPPSYQGWYLSLGSQKCSSCGKLPSEPALCLRCGAVVCCGSRRCQGPIRQGMCYTHSLACGGGTCCFLLIKMTCLLVIRKNRASLLTSPYVDSHGEEDVWLKRGKPLSLHADRLRHLLQLWRSGAFDFDSHVLHVANHRNEFATAY